MSSAAEIVLAACRFLAYLGILAAGGAVIAERLAAGPGAALRSSGSSAAALRVAVVALLLARSVQLLAQATWMFGEDGPLQAGQLVLIATQTSWGTGWLAQIAAAVALALAVLNRRRGAVALATIALVATQPLTGHALEDGFHWLAWLLQASHVGAAAAWIGTLAVLTAATLRGAANATSRQQLAGAWRSFSGLARGCVSVLTVSGAASAWIYMAAPLQPWASDYGRLLLLKVAGFAVVGLIGASNWRRILPKLPDAAATRSLLQACAAEVALATLVLALTAILAATSPS